uniref:Secreted protein n=1 Tax=Heterorhabditis bacteriophora TaxID=37862 RepID=A0A1I7WHS0_HETBA
MICTYFSLISRNVNVSVHLLQIFIRTHTKHFDQSCKLVSRLWFVLVNFDHIRNDRKTGANFSLHHRLFVQHNGVHRTSLYVLEDVFLKYVGIDSLWVEHLRILAHVALGTVADVVHNVSASATLFEVDGFGDCSFFSFRYNGVGNLTVSFDGLFDGSKIFVFFLNNNLTLHLHIFFISATNSLLI